MWNYMFSEITEIKFQNTVLSYLINSYERWEEEKKRIEKEQ